MDKVKLTAAWRSLCRRPRPIGGFLEALASPPYNGNTELAKIAVSLSFDINDLLPIAAALHILEFAELNGSLIRLTAAGRVFAQNDSDERKRLFREHLIRFVPLTSRQVLDERENHEAPRARFEFELQDHLNQTDADRALRAIIGWGRYAELWTFGLDALRN